MLAEKIQLESDETILIQVRKHWFVLFMRVIGVFCAGLFPALVFFVLNSSFAQSFTFFTISGVMFSGTYAMWLIALWIALFSIWTDYYLDIWIITNKRLIVVNQRGIFNRQVSSFRLERLQDINVIIQGFIATFLDFGSLNAQTASGEDNFYAYGLPHPQDLKALILRASDETTFGAQHTSLSKGEV